MKWAYSDVVVSSSSCKSLAIWLEMSRIDRGTGIVPIDDKWGALHDLKFVTPPMLFY